jgi:hypothetical protein
VTAPSAESRYVAWWSADGAILGSAWSAPNKTWSLPVAWSAPGEKSATGPWVEDRVPGVHELVYITESGTGKDRRGDIVLVRGNDSGPRGNATRVANLTLYGKGANADFAHYARLADGGLAIPFATSEAGKQSIRVAVSR